MKTLRERVDFLLGFRGISQAEATRRGGFKNTAFINDILRGHKESVRGDNLEKLATALVTNKDYLLGNTHNINPEDKSLLEDFPPVVRNFDREQKLKDSIENYEVDYGAPSYDPGSFRRDIPVRGVIVGGEDADFSFNGEPVDHVRRPAGLASKKDIYAIRVEGESMWPAHKHGALVYVDPHRRPGVGEDAVIELFNEERIEDRPGRGYLKRIKRISGSSLIAEQFNPPKDLHFDRADVKELHRVIPWEEVLGV